LLRNLSQEADQVVFYAGVEIGPHQSPQIIVGKGKVIFFKYLSLELFAPSGRDRLLEPLPSENEEFVDFLFCGQKDIRVKVVDQKCGFSGLSLSFLGRFCILDDQVFRSYDIRRGDVSDYKVIGQGF